MEMIVCPNCKKLTGYKRAIGFGTFFAVLITFGLWLLILPMYPKRCITCGFTKSASVPWHKTWRGIALVGFVGLILIGFLSAIRPIQAPSDKTHANTTGSALLDSPTAARLSRGTSDEKQEWEHAVTTRILNEPSTADCPIRSVHIGMMLEDVRNNLPGYVMDYRGSKQDQEVYHVDAGNCSAFIDFDLDQKVDFVEYDARQTNAGAPVHRRSSDPEQEKLNACVAAKLGVDTESAAKLEEAGRNYYQLKKTLGADAADSMGMIDKPTYTRLGALNVQCMMEP